MKSIFLIAVLVAVFHYHVDSAAVKLLPPSDLEVGTLSENDTLLYSRDAAYNPLPGIVLIKDSIKISSPYFLFTYLKAEQIAEEYTDARIELSEGGPGYNFFNVTIYPGSLGGYNYTIRGYGENFYNQTEYIVDRITNTKQF